MNETRIKALQARYNILAMRSNGEVTGVMRKIFRRINRERAGVHIA